MNRNNIYSNNETSDNNHPMDDALLSEDEEREFLNDLEGPPTVSTSCAEELFDSVLPPLHHVTIPNASSRRRAHTVDTVQQQRRASESIIHNQNQLLLEDGQDDDDSTLSVDLEEHNDTSLFRRPDETTAPTSQRTLRLTLSQESRLQRRQMLVNSRCVRGFLTLFVYGILVLQPSLLTATAPDALEPLDTPTTQPINNSTYNNKKKTLVPLANLPKFRHKPRTAGMTKYHKTNSTAAHHTAPPQIYHKKQRPILSAAHSYQFHQEPLAFGRELKTSFVVDSSDYSREAPSQFFWGTSLVWLSLLCLIVDTSYREWQYYRWHRRQPSTSSSSRRQHHRRSPSPVPVRRRQQQRRRPQQRPRFDSF
ncbi:expressed unknown protein [Seminavis robusta]|uniref:Uncharacterized protein n=1 Tax=Seminavis robusta TaxID=568900 RepID=A0A9N8EXZ6_9STRA|nr:expressed unknown protein [Seminavis robusta]|eukprot:Sro2341_g324070.1 n/a (365) ;mRNA; r:3109-4203